MLAKVGSGSITMQNLIKALDPPELRKETEPSIEELSPEEIAAAMLSRQRSGAQRSGSAIVSRCFS